MDLQTLLKVPAQALAGIDLFRTVLEQYADRPLAEGSVEEVVPSARREAFLAELQTAADRFDELMRQEIREFGVERDPNDLRYQWGSPEINEQVVRMIEAQYPLTRQGEVLFYGPSNITLWYSLEQDMLPWKAQNHGMGGCIDRDMMHYAPRLLYPYEPRVVFFQTGSNDIASGIPLEAILENKRTMYGLFLEHMPQTKLVVCSGLPLPGRTQFWDATVETNRLLEQLCRETERLFFLDATDAMLTDRGPEELRTGDGRFFDPALFRADKIHLNKRGHDVWTALMKAKLVEIGEPAQTV